MRFKIFFPLAALVLFAVVGCQKDGLETPVFVEKQYIPSGEVEATATVKSFLAAVKGAGERTTFADTEVNEGRWVMEGSANYATNMNMSVGKTDGVETYTFSVDNLNDNGTLKMSGTDMTTKFASLIADIAATENSTSRTAAAADFKVTSATATKTDMEVTVLYKKGAPSVGTGGVTFLQGANSIEILIESSLPFLEHDGCAPWHPEVTIFSNGATPSWYTDPITNATMTSAYGDIFDLDYPPLYAQNDASIAYNIALSKGNAMFTGTSVIGWQVEDIGVSVNLPFNPGLKQMFVTSVTYGFWEYCY